MMHDLRFACRMLVKDRWFTLVAVVALGLGIGLNTTVFAVVNAVLLRGLPYEDSDRIMFVTLRDTKQNSQTGVSYPDLDDWRTQARSFSGLGGFRQANMNLSETGKTPERTAGAWITANTFSLLGQPVFLGRDFLPGDGGPGAEAVAILGYTTWQSRYGGDPHVVGRPVKIDDTACTIVGVMPEGVMFPTTAGLWRPLTAEPNASRTSRSLAVFGRLTPGVEQRAAQAELRTITARSATDHVSAYTDLEPYVQTFNERFFSGGPIRIVFLSLMGAVGFVLLIACANVANLMLARSARRAREVAVRFAMGASRARIVRQLLVESTLLASLGGLLGLALAWTGVRLFDAAVAGTGKPYWIVFTIDPLVFAFLGAICGVTAVLFGMVPALQVTRTNTNEIFKESGRGVAGGRRAQRLTSTIVVAELALTMVLLAGAGLMVRSFLKLYSLDVGFETGHLLTTNVQLADGKYPRLEQRLVFYDELLPLLEAIPGVEAVGYASSLPLGGAVERGLEIDGQPTLPGQRAPKVGSVAISPRYFDVLGIQIRRGRPFAAADGDSGAETAIVDERFVTRFLKDEDPLGQRVRFVDDTGSGKWLTIVGVSPGVRQGSPPAIEPRGVVYVPARMDPEPFQNIIVRTTGDPASVTPQLREAVQSLDPDQPLFNVQTMDQVLGQVRWPYRVFGAMFAIFAIIALTLSTVGIYAVTAYSVMQRTAEIGIRLALGARAGQVSWLILRQGIVQLGIGLPIGLALAFVVSRVLQPVLVQVNAGDPVTFAAIALLLTGVTLAGCLLPARRATRLDPLSALRLD